MTIESSQDLWIEPTSPLGDVVEQSGPFGGVCGPIGGRAKNTTWRVWLFSRSTFWCTSSLSRLTYGTRVMPTRTPVTFEELFRSRSDRFRIHCTDLLRDSCYKWFAVNYEDS